MPFDFSPLADDYAQHRTVHPEVLTRLQAALPAHAPILEVGCGTGNYLRLLHSQFNNMCWGVEPAGEMLRQAASSDPGLHLVQAWAEQLPFTDETFSFVYTVDVLHHLTDSARYFQEAFRVLQPGGRICSVTETTVGLRTRHPLATCFPETSTLDLARYPTSASIETCMQAAGFHDLRTEVLDLHFPLTNIEAYRTRAYSCLMLLDEAEFAAGLAKLEELFRVGPITASTQVSLLWGRKLASS